MQQIDRRAYVVTLLDRLKRLYASRALLPRSDGRHAATSCPYIKAVLRGAGKQNDEPCTCAHQDGYRLGLWQLQRLFRAIISEHQE